MTNTSKTGIKTTASFAEFRKVYRCIALVGSPQQVESPGHVDGGISRPQQGDQQHEWQGNAEMAGNREQHARAPIIVVISRVNT